MAETPLLQRVPKAHAYPEAPGLDGGIGMVKVRYFDAEHRKYGVMFRGQPSRAQLKQAEREAAAAGADLQRCGVDGLFGWSGLSA